MSDISNFIGLLFCLCIHGVISLKEGDNCPLQDGSQGVCKLIVDCSPALELLKRGVMPDNNCGFKGTQSIICCTDISKIQSGPPPVTNPKVIRTVTYTNRTSGEISKQECKKYARCVRNRAVRCLGDTCPNIFGGKLTRIINRQPEFPHMVLIGYQAGNEILWDCGGSLISETYVLTAAHCLKGRQRGYAKFVKLGITDQRDSTNMQKITISVIIYYPEYVRTRYHDIGLLKLSKKADLNTYVRPACLHTNKNILYQYVTATGWGSTRPTATRGNNELLKVDLVLFSTQKCNKTYRKQIHKENSTLKNGIIEDLMICAGSDGELKDTCRGDSGGPLQVRHHDDTEYTTRDCGYDIVGVTSFGNPCGLTRKSASVYTRVSAYIKWIEDIVWPE